MSNVAGISFKESGKLYFFKVNNLDINDGNYVVVETDKGLQVGKVIISNIINKDETNDMKSIVRIATNKDLKMYESNKKEAANALEAAREIAKELDLNMNLLEANYTLDKKQLVFLFVSETRVDFREMARELASIYKTRIELRQIGVRDRAKEISGIGQCGRELCCSSFQRSLADGVSINMAKNQNLALNPSKINGQCGRLLCCLSYEDEVYTEKRVGLPNIGDVVKTDNGKGTVVSIDILKRSYQVDVPDEGRITVNVD